MTKLFKHQIEFLNKNLDKSALVWGCGTGKTKAAILWGKPYHAKGTIIICPKALKTNWQRELRLEGFFHQEFRILTKEEFRKLAPTLPYYGQIIVDEVHIGFLTPLWKSQMSKALKKYIEKKEVPRVLLLSATPYTSSPWNVFNLAYLLGVRWSWRKFRWEFFTDIRMGARIVPVPKKGCEKKLAILVKKIADVVDINDIMDVPLQYHADPEYFSLNLPQKKAVQLAYDPLPIVRYTKKHEIENGILIEEGRVFEFPSDKIDRIKAIVEENPKVAIVCRYNAQIDVLVHELRNYNVFVIRGDIKDRHSVCESAEKADKAVVIIQADCNAGYQLPSFGTVVFASMSYSYVAWVQLSGRFLRMDKPSRTTFLYLLTEGESIDQAIYDAIHRKEDFSIELYAKKKNNK